MAQCMYKYNTGIILYNVHTYRIVDTRIVDDGDDSSMRLFDGDVLVRFPQLAKVYAIAIADNSTIETLQNRKSCIIL